MRTMEKLENFTVSVPKTDENIQWLSDIFAEKQKYESRSTGCKQGNFHGDVPEKISCRFYC